MGLGRTVIRIADCDDHLADLLTLGCRESVEQDVVTDGKRFHYAKHGVRFARVRFIFDSFFQILAVANSQFRAASK